RRWRWKNRCASPFVRAAGPSARVWSPRSSSNGGQAEPRARNASSLRDSLVLGVRLAELQNYEIPTSRNRAFDPTQVLQVLRPAHRSSRSEVARARRTKAKRSWYTESLGFGGTKRVARIQHNPTAVIQSPHLGV